MVQCSKLNMTIGIPLGSEVKLHQPQISCHCKTFHKGKGESKERVVGKLVGHQWKYMEDKEDDKKQSSDGSGAAPKRT